MPVIYPHFSNSPTSIYTIADNPFGIPIIGYNNIVTADNLTSFTEDADHPLTNLITLDTFTYWKGGFSLSTGGVEYIDIVPGGATVDYIALAGHNLASINSAGILISDISVSPRLDLTSDIGYMSVSDNSPLICRFKPGVYGQLRFYIDMNATTAAPQAAVIYCGQLLTMERGVRVDKGHVPLLFGPKTTMVGGMSERANFMGRIVLRTERQSVAEFFGMTPTFYRSSFDTFLNSAREVPFFWAWAPSDYPLETGFVWLTKDAVPEVSPDHRRIALSLELAGIA